ncbi:MAG TPA: MBG domain-containing protein, partial [Acidobacteriaceae bacterium]
NSVTETIQANTLIVQVGNATRAYGTANPAFTSTITGALAGDTFSVSYSTLATPGSLPGSYVINATVAGTNIGAYTVTVIPGVLTVTTQVLTATANNFTRAYGAANPAFTGTVTGAANGDVFTETFTTTATASSLPGTYAIVPVVSGANLANYTLNIVPGVLTITQTGATLLLQASSTVTTYGSPIVLTAVMSGQNSVTPTGNVLFYDGTILLGTVPSSNGIATLTVATLAAGIHTLTAQSAGDANYGPTLSNSVVETITGTGSGNADYTVSASPASLSIKQGGTGSTTLTLTPLNGYAGQLTLGCTTLAQYASCAFSPMTVTLNGVSPVTVTLTVSTSAKVAAVQAPQRPGRVSGISYAGMVFFPAMLLAGVVCYRRRWVGGMRLTVVMLGVVTMLSLSGCAKVTIAGSSSGTGLTPVGTTTTTVTVSPVNVTTGVFHTLPIVLTVTQ